MQEILTDPEVLAFVKAHPLLLPELVITQPELFDPRTVVRAANKVVRDSESVELQERAQDYLFSRGKKVTNRHTAVVVSLTPVMEDGDAETAFAFRQWMVDFLEINFQVDKQQEALAKDLLEAMSTTMAYELWLERYESNQLIKEPEHDGPVQLTPGNDLIN